MILEIEHTWDGEPAREDERARVALALAGDELRIDVDAPFHGDPKPPGPPGPTPRLWEYEVVELFLLAEPSTYLEIELGPHGHHLVLALEGVRRIVREGMPIAYEVEPAAREGSRWRARARVPLSYLPERASRLNAYAIHGTGDARRYLAWRPVPGSAPDFHRLEAFGSFDPRSLRVG